MQNYKYSFPKTTKYTNLNYDINYSNIHINDIPNIFSPLNSYSDFNSLALTSSLNNEYNKIFGNNIKNLTKVHKLVTPIPRNSNFTSKSKKKTLVLDLDETLVHSGMMPFPNKNNIILHLTINNVFHTIYAIVRPFVDKFLQEMSQYYELKIFTASLSQYSKPLLLILDKNKVINQVLNREHCLNIEGFFFKDLNIFNKDLKDIIIVDNNPISYAFNTENGIPIETWIDNQHDNELIRLIPILKYLSKVDDVRPVINIIVNKDNGKLDFKIINELLKTDINIIDNYISNFDKNINITYYKNFSNNTKINNNININSPINYYNSIKYNYTYQTIPIKQNTKNNYNRIIKLHFNRDIINQNLPNNLKIIKLNNNQLNKQNFEIPRSETHNFFKIIIKIKNFYFLLNQDI